ncbi:MAG: diadenosine tetraphosphatase [Piscirickettsiaceae bacterium]|nr:MAG: diadenosine tetraphosphatase [Piscirickettsiaceae bacterium]PCI70235.1 MAG: diadenosine tetraphosphatase [Piscirickettsiaceae bacterium]
MTTYAIGDVQGCFDPLRRLLDKIKFDPSCDQLWFTGDLINRGPKSLETLRFIISLGDSARSVLGNHECHFLAIAFGHKAPYPADTFNHILKATDAEELFQWVRSLPFFYEDNDAGYSMLHAGLPPQWSIDDTRQHANELANHLQSEHLHDFLASMYGDQPDVWDANLTGNDRLRFIINCFTRLRFCDNSGRLNLLEKGAIGTQRDGLIPWFEAPNRKTSQHKIVFGHWSTLGFHQKNNTTCLDTGCLWGDSLSAMKLDGSEQVISIPCERSLKPF